MGNIVRIQNTFINLDKVACISKIETDKLENIAGYIYVYWSTEGPISQDNCKMFRFDDIDELNECFEHISKNN